MFIGMVVYMVHRCLIFPIIEMLLDLTADFRNRGGDLRRLISRRTTEDLLRRWEMGCESDRALGPELARHISIWADYTHAQYASAWSILFGVFFSSVICIGRSSPNYPSGKVDLTCVLYFLAAVFCLSAFVSDWRLQTVCKKAFELWPKDSSNRFVRTNPIKASGP
jgi:hypothetical protein